MTRLFPAIMRTPQTLCQSETSLPKLYYWNPVQATFYIKVEMSFGFANSHEIKKVVQPRQGLL